MKKQKVTHSVDKELLAKFNEVAEENMINKSKWVERQMYLYIKEME